MQIRSLTMSDVVHNNNKYSAGHRETARDLSKRANVTRSFNKSVIVNRSAKLKTENSMVRLKEGIVYGSVFGKFED